jgi:hypothetical protein
MINQINQFELFPSECPEMKAIPSTRTKRPRSTKRQQLELRRQEK